VEITCTHNTLKNIKATQSMNSREESKTNLLQS
jgi:hypothetical protein